MRRTPWLCLVLLTAAGAAPQQAALPVPPIPPFAPPTARLAPMPDPDLRAPPESSQLPDVSIQDFRVQNFDRSLGYVPGSRFETSEDKRAIQTPGLTVRVPLQ